jgi:hypothetical protein
MEGGQRIARGHMAPHMTANQGACTKDKGLAPNKFYKVGFMPKYLIFYC